MADQFLTHRTADGERWDQLADRYYGDAFRYVEIVDANPSVPLYAVLPAGLTLAIPVLIETETLADLPPWKR